MYGFCVWIEWWRPLRVLSLQSGMGEAEGFFTHTLEAPPRMGGLGWVAVAIRVSKILGSWLSPVASEESQHDCPEQTPTGSYMSFSVRSEVTMSLATFRELLVYPNPHPG